MTKSARARAFELENGTQSPKPVGDLVYSTEDVSPEQLFDLVDPTAPRLEHSADIPEVITLEEAPILPEEVMRAFAIVVRKLNMAGKVSGVDTMDGMTGATNRFRTETTHSHEARDHMDGKVIALDADTEGAYDVLNNTTERLLAGEDPAAVARSREYIKFTLEQKLKTVPAHKVGTGDIPLAPMNAKIRNAMLKDPKAVKKLLDITVLRSK